MKGEWGVRPQAESGGGCDAARTGSFENYFKLMICFKYIFRVELGSVVGNQLASGVRKFDITCLHLSS